MTMLVAVDLFGREMESAESLFIGNGDHDPDLRALKAQRHGDVGELLTFADLISRKYEAAIQKGVHTDVNVEVNGIYRRLQVKASGSNRFGPGGGHKGTGVNGGKLARPFGSYKGLIDGFAFVSLPTKAVYYMHIDAIADDQSGVTISNLSRDACNMSWNEMLRRFGDAA
jgi:hypothetical protein